MRCIHLEMEKPNWLTQSVPKTIYCPRPDITSGNLPRLIRDFHGTFSTTGRHKFVLRCNLCSKTDPQKYVLVDASNYPVQDNRCLHNRDEVGISFQSLSRLLSFPVVRPLGKRRQNDNFIKVGVCIIERDNPACIELLRKHPVNAHLSIYFILNLTVEFVPINPSRLISSSITTFTGISWITFV